MSKLYKLLLAIVILVSLSFTASAQWSSRNVISGITTDKAVARMSYPKEFKLFDLNIAPLRQQLFTITDKVGQSTIISLPNADGQIEKFEVYEASNFEPALQAKFPEIRAFSGRGITDRYATLKLSISPQGIQTMVFRTERDNEFIEPYSLDHKIYSVFRSSREKGRLPWTCTTEDKQMASDLNSQIGIINKTESSAGNVKTMRLAQSCNGEYSNFFGAFNSSQVALVLAAFNATLTRCNGCYEKDLAIHLNLIANTTAVIFYDPATDPYTTLGAWNGQLQATLTAIIGEANYDIGHMFGASGGGGNAGCIGCVCVDGIKGSGITSPADGIPMGDNFDIDYVVHEVGHQMGGNHTFSMSLEGGGVNNVEVGSGITIMAYAGITGFDVAPHSIDIYHERSIQQIQNNMAGKTCPINTPLGANNATPVVAPVGPFTIPISTPFALTGSATDADGDPLTYCWEQNDAANGTTTGANSIAFQTKLVGPNWLSFSQTVSPTRTFPRLSTILAGGLTTGPLPGGDPGVNIEALSSVARTLNFRLTVRDNCPYVPGVKIGQTQFTDVAVTVTNTSGPFQVTSPNTAVSWPAGSSQAVTWDVNNTTAAPVSCAMVNILFSSDGGQTFPVTLVSNTPNDGSENITVPGTLTSTARIKVEAVGNIFFDICNTNFTVAAPPTGFSFNNPAPATSACPAGPNMQITLGTISNGGFVNPITLSATGNPGGTGVTFTPNPVVPGNNVTVTLTGTNTLNNGSYVIGVTGTATGAPNQSVNLTYTINAGAAPNITGQPTNQSICAAGNASFAATVTGALTYQWQESINGGGTYNNVNNGGVYSNATTATLTITGAGAGMNGYMYRLVATGQCGVSTSNPATLTVSTGPTITGQPADVTICASANTSFTVTATGTGLTYQWEESTNGGGLYTPIVNGGVYGGAGTATLTLSGVTAGMNTYRYRAVVTGGSCGSSTSNGAILNVVTAVAITTQPTNSTVCAGANTNFVVAGSGAGIIYQWQFSTDGGANYNNVPNTGVYSGATTATLNITGATVAMNGYRYRASLSNATCTSPGISNAAILTVNSLPSISANPVNTTICLGSNTSFGTTAAGTGIGYQWQVSTDGVNFTNVVNGGVYTNATTATLNITAPTLLMSGSQYRVVVTGTCAPPATSTAALLTVIAPVAITTPPAANRFLCANDNTTFAVTATSVQTINYQWQVSTDGGANYTNVPNTGVYSGATTNTLTITGATSAMNSYRYRVQASNATCATPTISAAGILTVHALPTIGLTAAPFTSLVPGHTTTLTATPSAASAGSAVTSTWYLNGTLFPNVGNTFVVDVEKIGGYQVKIQEAWTDGSVCLNQSATQAIDATPSPKLFIYPNPSNDGNFTVSYFNNGGTSTSRTVTVYDSKGQRAYTKKFSITGPYTLIHINMTRSLTGIYYVVVGDLNGKKLIEGNILVH